MKELFLNAMTWLGLALFLVGFILLSRKALHSAAVESGWRLVLLGLCSLYVPITLILGLFAGYALSLPFFWYSALTGLHGLSPVEQFPELWLALLGVVWVVVASWLAVSLNAPRSPDRRFTQ